ncbi:MAG: DUF1214 domain-containing protein [Myxococcales bacterium]|nr:DUF1214 domain-containing protein [Myxococcales bacterium]
MSVDEPEGRMMNEAAQRLMDGSAWGDFCDTLKNAGSVILSDRAPADPLDRAEGFRYLTRLTRAALERFVEHADPRFPVLSRMIHETAKIGADNPDNHYFNTAISGAEEYRISGTRGTVFYLGFGTQAGNYGSTGKMVGTGYLEAADMEIGPDGRIEIAVSSEPKPGNWLPMRPETDMLIVRQTFLDQSTEVPADLRVERVGGDRAPTLVTPEGMEAGLRSASFLVLGCAAMFANWAEGFRERPNELPEFDPDLASSVGGDPNIRYYHGYWELGPDEALVIDAAPPACPYWNFQLNNYWMESLEYRFHHIHVNKHTARYAPDGSVRVVVAHEDPGLPNWLETTGHRRGTMCWRWVRATEYPVPRTRVVKLADLRREARR